MNTLWNVFWNFYSSLRPYIPSLFISPPYIPLLTPESPERPPSPEPLKTVHDCGNYLCGQFTEDISHWKCVQKKKRYLYFCSERCWEEWLDYL